MKYDLASLIQLFKRNYDVQRRSEAFLVTLALALAFVVGASITVVSTSQTVQDIIKSVIRREEKRKVEPPKPVVLPKNVPIKLPEPPKVDKMQKLDQRMVVKKTIDSKLRPKPLTTMRRKELDFKRLKDMGAGVRGAMYGDYAHRFDVVSSGAGIQATIEQFVVVSYEGGDWDCEFHHHGEKVDLTKGSLPNLIREIERRTNIKVINKVPVAVRADSPEIHKSPFVYFTGHRNFTLTEAEVENLRTYILQGGAVVANSSLAGRRSRFDEAFRREMKRVIPDYDFKPIGSDHPLFKAFATFDKIPVGMNYWQEPLEIIEIDGRVVVIYNLNNYGGLMLATLDETGQAIKRGVSAEDPTYRWEGPRIWPNTRRLYANVDDVKTVVDAYVFNINILAYLLTR